MTKIEKLIKKILTRMFPFVVQADVELLNIEHEFKMTDDYSMNYLGIRAVKPSGIETLTITFKRRIKNDTSDSNLRG